MPLSRSDRRSSRGFTLIELSVVIVILSLIGGTFLTTATRKTEARKQQEIAARLDLLEDALQRYADMNGRLPCPAPEGQKEGTAAFGRSDTACSSSGSTVVQGAVPVRTLGLPDRAMFDSWSSRIHYAVIRDLTVAAKYDNVRLQNTLTTGIIRVIDASGTQINPAVRTAIVPWLLLSYGPDKRGAFTRAADSASADPALNAASDCPSSALENENCDGNAVFRDMASRENSRDDSVFFDDTLRWRAYESAQAVSAGSTAVTPDIESVRVADTHVCALRNTGRAYCWGNNDSGQFGIGATTAGTIFKPTLSGFTSVDTLGTYRTATCGLKDLSASCAGANLVGGSTYGKLALGTTNSTNVPAAPTGTGSPFVDWEQLEGTTNFACGRRLGRVFCFGQNRYGELGVGTMGSNASTYYAKADRQTGASTDWTDLRVGPSNACGIRGGTLLACWGRLSEGMIPGNGTTPGSVTCTDGSGAADCGTLLATAPAMSVPPDGTDAIWTGLSLGDGHACGVRSTRRVWCWGKNNYRQASPAVGSTPAAMNDINTGWTADAAVAFGNSSCVLNAGLVYCWGLNDQGQLGNGNTTNQTVPTQVVNLRDVKRLHAVQKTVCALKIDHSVWCWGAGASGQLGGGTATSSSSPVFVGLP